MNATGRMIPVLSVIEMPSHARTGSGSRYRLRQPGVTRVLDEVIAKHSPYTGDSLRQQPGADQRVPPRLGLGMENLVASHPTQASRYRTAMWRASTNACGKSVETPIDSVISSDARTKSQVGTTKQAPTATSAIELSMSSLGH